MGAFLKSFAFAAKGFCSVVKTQRNMRFHLCATFYVLVFSFFYGFSAAEYCLIFFAICCVISAEMFNTAAEHIVDALCPEWNKSAGFVKDVAAGAVLVACVGAAACGFLLFLKPSVFAKITNFFAIYPLLFLLFLASLAASWFFVFCKGRHKKENR